MGVSTHYTPQNIKKSEDREVLSGLAVILVQCTSCYDWDSGVSVLS